MSTNKEKQYGISHLALGTVAKNGNRKVYISNYNLGKSIAVGTQVNAEYDKKNREIVVKPLAEGVGTHVISSKKNGRAVLDIKNKEVGETIGNVENIEIIFYKNKIVIKVPKCILEEETRNDKTELTCFEVCSGGATMSDMFEQAGFTSKGAIELLEQNIAVYHENHKDHDTYTVNANIEDIDVNSLPKDITALLLTLPCTGATNANNKLATEIKKKREGLEYNKEVIEEMERLDALMFYGLNIIQAMNPKTIIFENVEEYTKDPYDKKSERGVYSLAKTILRNKGYKLSEHIGESHNTRRKRWVMIAHYGDNPISLNSLNINQTKTTIGELLAIKDEDREWGTVYDFAPSRLLNNPIGIRSVDLDDHITPTFSTHATRRNFPILHKDVDGIDYYSTFTPEDIKNIHGLSKSYILPKEKTVALRILGQGVSSMFYEVAKIIQNHYKKTNYKMMEKIDEVKEIIKDTTEVVLTNNSHSKQKSLFDFLAS